MKRRILRAMESGNQQEVRQVLVEAISRGSADDIDIVTLAIRETPQLFDPDDGKEYPAAEEMTPPHIAALREDLLGNFSIRKLQLLTDLYGLINADMEASFTSGATQSNQNFQASRSSQSSADSRDDKSYPDSSKPSAAKILGYVIMILGAAASIVGICIPVNFLIGVGIGVILLGSVITVSGLRN